MIKEKCVLFLAMACMICIVSCNDKLACDNLQKITLHDYDTLQLLQNLDFIIKKDPTCVDALLIRGDFRLDQGKEMLGLENFFSVIKNDPENTYALYKIGICYSSMNKYDSALNYFDLALKNKTDGNVITDYTVKIKKNQTKKDKYDVQSSELFYQKAISYYYLRSLNDAYRNFDICISDNYKIGESYFYQGAILIEKGIKDSACEKFNQAVFYGNNEAINYIKRYCDRLPI